MYYEINIAKLEHKGTRQEGYVHFFATAKRSIHSRIELKKYMMFLRMSFLSLSIT